MTLTEIQEGLKEKNTQLLQLQNRAQQVKTEAEAQLAQIQTQIAEVGKQILLLQGRELQLEENTE